MKKTNLKPSVIMAGFTQNQVVLLSPLIRKIWGERQIVCADDYFDLKDELVNAQAVDCPAPVIVVNGWEDFYELDALFLACDEAGIKPSGAIFFEGTKRLSLAVCTNRGLPLILADLEREEELKECAEAMAAGRQFWSKSVFLSARQEPPDFPTLYGKLSPQEKICCAAILTGKTHRQIAQVLGVAKSTVDTHCYRLFKKFGVSCLSELEQCFSGKNE